MIILLILLSMTIFYIRFEKKTINAEEIVLIAMLSAIAAVGRIPFAALPSVQPTSFIIIITAKTFGREVGFLVGNFAALVSNIFLGQGPWTLFQMISWGLMGFTAGMFKEYSFLKAKAGLCTFAAIWGFLYGWMMNLWYLVFFQAEDITWRIILASSIASLKFDINHAICNVILILLFNDRWLKILKRAKEKYGLLKQ
jgi:energy-coupling factor transport system substrate-specific component